MTLEDTVGDIIRKARQSANVSPEAAARAAGISPEEFAGLEDSGKCLSSVNYEQVAKLVSLDGAKLRRIAAGWLPAPIDTGAWRELRQITTSGMGMTVN